MIEIAKMTGSKEENYALALKQVQAMITGETNLIANLSNVSSILNQALTNINWVGFYLFEKEKNELVLGPFQGLPACIRIPLGKGVCGSAALDQKTYIVEDVHQFPGHIACDAASNSEIVLPLVKNEQLIGVLDIDSPSTSHFDKVDQLWLEKIRDAIVHELPNEMN
ncbi:GAF domain-containing protein [Listeria ivanovii]|uniref:GAF domain-containing protein n=2 Tax=Listeria ivanovii TaxID=1638 RepID=A0ABS1G4U2_LISIV|nr:GAF domain-containing protein [Listeria ivanovii]EFR96773.1 protein YebR [Listeria ivanovii FSL F6-596]AIS60000.1 GAF domain-containing protein [Listeria ivanovii subsp. londoniensis]AIS62825.1 GAF domain-containing protein [Listeria ivanovii subsp. londoniensis]MBK1961883.1 GAF domain-containing protein [Listeria ivanovii subsp. londoniensis]MBK1966881.1 GAF domain-containing protein [Listeria ivanovii subsp. londoniensis]